MIVSSTTQKFLGAYNLHYSSLFAITKGPMRPLEKLIDVRYTLIEQSHIPTSAEFLSIIKKEHHCC